MAKDGRDFGPRGDPRHHLPLEPLQCRVEALAPAPRDRGRVALVVRRGPDKVRTPLAIVTLRPGGGVPGDAWARHPQPDPQAELTVMQLDVAQTIANGQPLTLFGDNLFVELDLSAENLPTGSRLRVGRATLEVTAKPHDGCRKFAARFGKDALRVVSSPELRHRNLRGIYLRVVAPGEVTAGDPIEVLSRPA